MTKSIQHTRRGVALLIVLAAMILILTVITATARLAAHATARRTIDETTRVSDDLLAAADAPIEHWLATEAEQVVLPPETASPSIEVLHETFPLGARQITIRITAFDQCGMVPWEFARAASPLRLALPYEVLRLIDEEELDPPIVLGLDLLAVESGADWAIFPSPSLDPADEDESQLSQPPPAVGAYVATHTAEPDRAVINVNTAPQPLLEAALRAVGRGGIEAILAARERDQSAGVPPRTGGQAGEQTVALTSTSRAWAFRIDLRVDRLERSWWEVRVFNAEPKEDSSRGQSRRRQPGWRLVQRLAIVE